MNRTRWKLLIGTLGLSLGGLAAIADVPSQNGIISCTPGKPQQVARVNYQEPPIPIPVPKVADVPLSGAPMTPAPAIIPVIGDISPPSLPRHAPTPAPLVAIPSPPPIITLSEPERPQPAPVFIDAPRVGTEALRLPTPQPLSMPVNPASGFTLPSLPEPVAVKPTPAPPTVPAPIVIERIPASPPPLGSEQPVIAQEIPRIPADPLIAKPILPAPTPSWEPRAQAIPTEAPSEPARNLEKKLKVLLHMGDERPRFEVKEGDEIYLKVISDKVEVKSPSDSGANMSVMRAGGKVTFITPGGEGTCDELSVIPGTGQVIVTGKVAFTYNWGKVETTVSGEKMTFRLGSTPGTTPSSGTQGVPTSYQRMR